MVALFFLLLGGLVLLVAACRIWMTAPTGTFKETNAPAANNSGMAETQHRV